MIALFFFPHESLYYYLVFSYWWCISITQEWGPGLNCSSQCASTSPWHIVSTPQMVTKETQCDKSNYKDRSDLLWECKVEVIQEYQDVNYSVLVQAVVSECHRLEAYKQQKFPTLTSSSFQPLATTNLLSVSMDFSLPVSTPTFTGIFIGRTGAEAEPPIFWPPDGNSWLIRKDPDAGKDWRWWFPNTRVCVCTWALCCSVKTATLW